MSFEAEGRSAENSWMSLTCPAQREEQRSPSSRFCVSRLDDFRIESWPRPARRRAPRRPRHRSLLSIVHILGPTWNEAVWVWASGVFGRVGRRNDSLYQVRLSRRETQKHDEGGHRWSRCAGHVHDIRSSTLCSQDTRWHGRLPSTRAVSQSTDNISGHRNNFRRTIAIKEKTFVMLANLQFPSLQENERLGREYEIVYFLSEYVACFVLAARHVVARRRHLHRPRLPSEGDLLSADLESLSSIPITSE